jgi:hypothetical protein
LCLQAYVVAGYVVDVYLMILMILLWFPVIEYLAT